MEEMRRKFGEAAPVTGRFFEGMVIETPAQLASGDLRAPYVEGELVVRFGRDLPPRDASYEAEELLDAIDSVIPAIEFADIRSASITADDVLDVAALNAGAYRLILGDPIEGWRNQPLLELGAEIKLDGEVVSTAWYGRERTDLFWAVHYLANELSKRGIGLTAGQVFSTGAILPYPRLGNARHASFEVEGQRPVELVIVD